MSKKYRTGIIKIFKTLKCPKDKKNIPFEKCLGCKYHNPYNTDLSNYNQVGCKWYSEGDEEDVHPDVYLR